MPATKHPSISASKHDRLSNPRALVYTVHTAPRSLSCTGEADRGLTLLCGSMRRLHSPAASGQGGKVSPANKNNPYEACMPLTTCFLCRCGQLQTGARSCCAWTPAAACEAPGSWWPKLWPWSACGLPGNRSGAATSSPLQAPARSVSSVDYGLLLSISSCKPNLRCSLYTSSACRAGGGAGAEQRSAEPGQPADHAMDHCRKHVQLQFVDVEHNSICEISQALIALCFAGGGAGAERQPACHADYA